MIRKYYMICVGSVHTQSANSDVHHRWQRFEVKVQANNQSYLQHPASNNHDPVLSVGGRPKPYAERLPFICTLWVFAVPCCCVILRPEHRVLGRCTGHMDPTRVHVQRDKIAAKGNLVVLFPKKERSFITIIHIIGWRLYKLEGSAHSVCRRDQHNCWKRINAWAKATPLLTLRKVALASSFNFLHETWMIGHYREYHWRCYKDT